MIELHLQCNLTIVMIADKRTYQIVTQVWETIKEGHTLGQMYLNILQMGQIWEKRKQSCGKSETKESGAVTSVLAAEPVQLEGAQRELQWMDGSLL